MRDLQLSGRSTVHGVNGACATSHPLASIAALDMLKRDGNAVDAAIAAAAVLCVVEPMSTGIGGDCFVLYAPNGGPDVIGLNGSGRAPQNADPEKLRDRGWTSISFDEVEAVTIPGAVDAWQTLMHDHGTLGLDAVLQPAISLAEMGFAVSPRIARDWQAFESYIGRTDAGRKHSLINGSAPKCGETFSSPALAKTLRAIASEGRDGFYSGRVAQDMVQSLNDLGGAHTLEDFAATEATYVEPIWSTYRNLQVLELPPNGQGLTALLMLNILQEFDISSFDPLSPERLHLEIEAQRLAFHMRDRFICDPEFENVPVEAILDRRHAQDLASQIDPSRAMVDPADHYHDPRRDTVYLSVVDRDRNAVSFINSLFMPFGSGLVSQETGVTFQNRGFGFSLDPTHPNYLQGSKRPKHTIIPAMARPASPQPHAQIDISFGVMGGDYQPVGHTHVITNITDFGMDMQEALDAPRVFYSGQSLVCERGIPEQSFVQLGDFGHNVTRADQPHGGGQIVSIDWQQGTLVAASDPRKDGCALAY